MVAKGECPKLVGQRFGSLVVVRKESAGAPTHTKWLCVCDCGASCITRAGSLWRGKASCGCLRRHFSTHGETKTHLYKLWARMKNRCLSSSSGGYKAYGAKGVSVCDDWLSFEPFRDWSFSHGYDETLTIERRDPFGNYEPANCCWIPMSQQYLNKRNTLRALDGRRVVEIRQERGISAGAFHRRLKRGWSVERAATETVAARHREASVKRRGAK